MPLHIDDEETSQLVTELAERLGPTEQDAVKSAVRAELHRLTPSLREKLEDLRSRHPPPVPTGKLADKAFFDALSGKLA